MLLSSRDSDARLAARARMGDEKSFERLYERYQPRLFAFCRHLTGHREDAEDAVQYTFLTTYRALVESDQRLEIRPWLFTVARNRCRSLLRARRVRRAEERLVAEASVGPLDEHVEHREELRALVGDLGRLPEDQRAALLLTELGALNHREVAAVLDVPTTKVKALVFQARSSLASTRAARDVACEDIRRQLATLSGSALRRRHLRRHVHDCSGCSEFEAAIADQRRGIAALLPTTVVAGGRGGAAVVAAGGGAGAAGGGLFSGGVAGSLISLIAPGTAKVAIGALVVAGGVTAVATTDLPARIGSSPRPVDERSTESRTVLATAPGGGQPRDRRGESALPEGVDRGRREAGADAGRPEGRASASSGDEDGKRTADERQPISTVDPQVADEEGGSTPASSLPPGLARKDELPPGLARKDELPPGLAKRQGGAGTNAANGKAVGRQDGIAGAPSGQGRANGNGGRANGVGQGNNGHGGSAKDGGAPTEATPAPGNGGGQANGGGQGNGGGGQGNGNGPDPGTAPAPETSTPAQPPGNPGNGPPPGHGNGQAKDNGKGP